MDISASNQKLIDTVESARGFYLLHAPRGSGKSTRMQRLKEQLIAKGFACFDVDLQSVDLDANSTIDGFWKEFASALSSYNLYPSSAPISSAATFRTWLSDPTNFIFKTASVPETPKVVLIIDEFDKLYQASQAVKDGFLGALRSLRQEPGCLWAVLGVGPYSILTLTSETSTPFTATEAIQISSFTKEEVFQLFTEFAASRLITLPNELIEDIYERTAGHAGLVCYCGKMIEKTIDEGWQNKLNHYEAWLAYAPKLPVDLITAPNGLSTMAKLVSCMDNPDVREFVVKYFLHGDQPVLQDANNAQMLAYLTAEGV